MRMEAFFHTLQKKMKGDIFMKRFISVICGILVCIVSLGDVKTVAASTENELISEIEIFNLDDEEIVAKHNKRVEELWNQALEESSNGENINSWSTDMQNARILPSWETSVATKNVTIGGVVGSVKFSATYTTSTTGAGVRQFDSVINLDAYPNYDNTVVTLNASNYTFIDSRRTIAAQYSLRVGVKQYNQTYKYSTTAFYVEYYINGKSAVY